MTSVESVRKCESLIDELLERKSRQNEVNEWYDHFIGVYQDEMRRFVKELKDVPQTKTSYRLIGRPW